MAPLPLLKLGGLAVKSLAKPLAKRLKYEAAQRPTLHNSCVYVGQMTHKASAWINIASAGHKSMGIKELETSAAFQRGADFMSETFIFAVGGGVIVFEYNRSKLSEAAKAREKAAQWLEFTQALDDRLTGIEARMTKLEAQNKSWERKWLPRVLGGESADAASQQSTPPPKFFSTASTATTTSTTTTAKPAPILDVIPPSEAMAEMVTSPSPLPPPPVAPPAGFPSSSLSTSWIWRMLGYGGNQGIPPMDGGSGSSSSATTTPLEVIKVVDGTSSSNSAGGVPSDKTGGGRTK